MIGHEARLFGMGRRTTLALLAAMVTGCMPPGGPEYVLTPVPGPILTGSPMTVSVRGVSVPQFLRQLGIVYASDIPRPQAIPSEWWAEPLDLMIGRVMTQDLMQRLPGSRVFFDPAPPYTPSDVWVDVTVARFDTNPAGDVLVQAQVGVVGLRFLTRTAWRTVTPANGSTKSMVTALSIALATFSDLIATLVVESRAQGYY